MLYRKQTTAMPTKNSAEEAESPTMCVVVTEWLQIVVFPSMSGTWLNLATKQDKGLKLLFTVSVFPNGSVRWSLVIISLLLKIKSDINASGFSPKWVMKVGTECLIPPIATEERYDVAAWESTTASESKYGRELFGQERARHERNGWNWCEKSPFSFEEKLLKTLDICLRWGNDDYIFLLINLQCKITFIEWYKLVNEKDFQIF